MRPDKSLDSIEQSEGVQPLNSENKHVPLPKLADTETAAHDSVEQTILDEGPAGKGYVDQD